MRLFCANPQCVWLVRGNHEEKSTWSEYSFGRTELCSKYGSEDLAAKRMFTVFSERLPHALFLVGGVTHSEELELEPEPEPEREPHLTTVSKASEREPRSPPPPPQPPPPPAGCLPAPPPPSAGNISRGCKDTSSATSIPRWKQKQLQQRQEVREAQARLVREQLPPKPAGSYFIQCCHGGIEPRYDPRFLLHAAYEEQSGDGVTPEVCFAKIAPQDGTLAPNALENIYSGYNWSDFTGLSHGHKGSTFERCAMDSMCGCGWAHNSRGGDSGFMADMEDTRRYMAEYGIEGIVRGHQDEDCALKLVVRGEPYVTPWQQLLAGKTSPTTSTVVTATTAMGTRNEETVQCLPREPFPQFPMSRLTQAEDSVPVLTQSTAAEARSMVDEGFGLLHVEGTLVRVDAQTTGAIGDTTTGAVFKTDGHRPGTFGDWNCDQFIFSLRGRPTIVVETDGSTTKQRVSDGASTSAQAWRGFVHYQIVEGEVKFWWETTNKNHQ